MKFRMKICGNVDILQNTVVAQYNNNFRILESNTPARTCKYNPLARTCKSEDSMSSALTRIVERFVEQALAGAEELARPATLGCINSGIPHPSEVGRPQEA